MQPLLLPQQPVEEAEIDFRQLQRAGNVYSPDEGELGSLDEVESDGVLQPAEFAHTRPQ